MANVPGAENGDAAETADPFADREWSPDEVAYNGKIVNVHLGDGSVEREDIPEQMYKDYLGGYGIGARLLFDRIPAGADPLGPDNVLGLMPGLLTGTPIFGNRFQAVCKSPSTGGWGDANCGGDFGPYLKFAGWDGILFYGQAENPVYILIDGDDVSVEDASEYWGMGAIEVENAFKEKYGKKTSVACIGPSGEQLSYLAGICNEHGRLAARSGVGAVMGSKKVKAVVVRAGGTPRENMLGRDTGVRELARQSRNEFIAPLRDFFAGFGTTGISTGSAHNGDSPVRNWGGVGVDVFPEVDSMSGMVFNATRMTHAELEIDPATGMPPIDPDHSPAPRAVDVNGKAVRHKSYGCWRCPMACGAESIESPFGTVASGLTEAEHEKGVFKYPVDTHRAEYETVASFGTMNLSANIDMMQAANHWCNEYGLDTIGAGTTISFAIECFENGLIDLEDTGGVELTWSNDDGIMEMLHLIGKREGFGDLLADGMQVAAAKIDEKNGDNRAQEFRTDVGGQELPMHDAKLQPEYWTTYKLDPTPARHTQYEGNSRYGGPEYPTAPRDFKDYENRGEHHKGASEYMHITNSTGMCQFIMMAAPTDRFPQWINAVTGWDLSG
ncbi:MAG: hypothetical protein OXN87_05300, partial [Chloroflexota bacterium]|nr:hypothetical protein [Chloroflexota bacterium]